MDKKKQNKPWITTARHFCLTLFPLPSSAERKYNFWWKLLTFKWFWGEGQIDWVVNLKTIIAVFFSFLFFQLQCRGQIVWVVTSGRTDRLWIDYWHQPKSSHKVHPVPSSILSMHSYADYDFWLLFSAILENSPH